MSAGKDYMDPEYENRMGEEMAKAVSRAARRARGKVLVPDDCPTLKEAVVMVHGDDHLNTIVVGGGEHRIDGYILEIPSAMNIVGVTKQAKSEIVVVGGIEFKYGIRGNCHLQHLTLRQAEGHGVWGDSSFTMEDVLVEQCGGSGVFADGTGVVAQCINVEVRQCEESGVIAWNGASITLIGAKTKVHHNCTDGDSDDYGLEVRDSSTIQLVSPLTKEEASFDNGGGGNWGAIYGADINQIKTIFERMPETEVRVPEDYKTLKEAVKKVHEDSRLTTIVVGEGEHQIDGDLVIPSAMNIVGDPGMSKSGIVAVGGIEFGEGIQGNCHLQHMTLRSVESFGVFGYSSFTMDDVLVEQCGYYGVYAEGTGVVARCTNVEVRECRQSGMIAWNGGSITLIGTKTKVHHNCTDGDSDEYGLLVNGFDHLQPNLSTIQLVSPLTKEQVSFANYGGGNWGAENSGDINKIKTIFERMPEAEVQLPVNGVRSLNEAVKMVDMEENLTTIVLGEGVHQINGSFLRISSAMCIVGRPDVDKEKIVVLGGIRFNSRIQGNCHLQHLTLRKAKNSGVVGYSSFTIDDVLVEECRYGGMYVEGTGVVGRCTNVEVRQCGNSGVVAQGDASIIFQGAKTKVHDNCTDGRSDCYGLKIGEFGTPTIQLVSPLTKEKVSINNGGGGNWGAEGGADINQIKNRLSPLIQSLYTRLFTIVTLHSFVYDQDESETEFATIWRKLDEQGQLNVNHKNEQGLTMLVTACLNSQIKWIKILMKKPQIDGTMTRERFIRCTGFPTTWLENKLKLNYKEIFDGEKTIDGCPVRCLPCRHPFEGKYIRQWLAKESDEPTTCPICKTEVKNVELMSTELVERWNAMDAAYTETGKEQYKFSSRYRQFVKTKL